MKPDLKVYRGYASNRLLMVFGHAFHKQTIPLSEKKRFKHAYSVLRTFRRKTIENAEIFLVFDGKRIRSKTLKDGYFRFSVPLDKPLTTGWHKLTVELCHSGKSVKKQAEVLSPYPGDLAFVSDIDDTFLISHTNNLFKKLYVLLWKNVNDRQFFEDVTHHYQLLNRAGINGGEANAFFYVSSSEWNLYGMIERFTTIHKLPKAVMKLKDIKTSLLDFLVTGRGSHDHKFIKIKDLIEFYPDRKFVLLGDDSQADPRIYERLCKYFPKNIKAIYIRQTKKQPKAKIISVLKNVEDLGVTTCYFRNSEEAIKHSQQAGIIKEGSGGDSGKRVVSTIN